MGWIAISATAVALIALGAWLVSLLLRERKMRRRFEILGQVAAVSDAAGSLEETLEAICKILVPAFADFCAIDLIEEGAVRRAVVKVAPGAPAGVERGMRERRPSLPQRMIEADGEEAIRPRTFERISERELRQLAHDEEDLAFLREIGVRSAITVALKARGQVMGALGLGVAWSGRRYRAEEERFAWILSGRIALALDNSGLFSNLERAEASRAQIAETLQHGLLPPPLPHIPGWSLAALYRPAGAENEVGGDFYDAFPVAGGWIVVVGDVTGRGARAASLTALARYTLRTAAVLTDDPLVALATLNRALLARHDASLCSVVALVLADDPAEPVRFAVAGHPPPLLIDSEGVSLAMAANPVLGVFPDVDWRIGEIQVGPNRQMVVITDGVTDAGGELGRFGEDRLRGQLLRATSPVHAVQRIEAALHEFTAGSLDDDAAIVGLTRSEEGGRHDLRSGTRQGDPEIEPYEALVERLYGAFNQRDAEGIVALCSEEMEFLAVTGEEVGRMQPYRGAAGLQEYLRDVERVWEELLITPSHVDRMGDCLLVVGRVYLRSRALGIRDMPVAWVWQLREGIFVRGEVFADPEAANMRFVDLAAA